MKISQSFLLSIVGSFVFALGSASADDLYFRPDSGNIPATDGVYDWDTSTASWFASETGGTGEAWDNGASGVARLVRSNAPYTIQLAEDITVAGIAASGSQPNNTSVTITSKNVGLPSTLTFESGATLNWTDKARTIQFENINIEGSFAVTRGRVSLGNGVNFASGTQITINSSSIDTNNGPLLLSGETNANVVLADNNISLNTPNGSLSRLSGIGNIARESPGTNGIFTLNQNDNTVLTGHFVTNNFSFTKEGTGTFIFGDGIDHAANRNLTISEGAFYTNGTFIATTSSYSFTVADHATVGGTFTANRSLTLEGSGSTVTPGMATLDGSSNVVNHVGSMELKAGLSATSGGIFDFYLDESATDLISLIKVTGGTVSLSNEITINLYGLGAGELQENVAYTLFDASGATSFSSDATWKLGDNTTGLEIYSYGFNESTKQFQVTFGTIPEPSSILLLLGGSLLILFVCRHRLRNPLHN